MTELTPRDDIKKKVSEILKRVDHLIRAGEIDQAVREIIHAKEIDPRNVYIFAYEERLTYLKEEHEKHRQLEITRKDAEEGARKRDEEARKHAAAEVTRRAESEVHREAVHVAEETPPIPKQPSAAPSPAPVTPTPAQEPPPSVEHLERELLVAEAELRRKQSEQARASDPAASHEEDLAKYRLELANAWEDGSLTPLEESRLKDLRMELSVTIQEHHRLTKEVQHAAYQKGVRQLSSGGGLTPERLSELQDLRKRFQILPDESDKLDAEILWETRSSAPTATLVLVDDDVKLLNLVTEILGDANYTVRSFTTSDDAYRFLKDNTPDLIISDINLETSTMGGFTFYEKIREFEHLQNVPFIFLSGLTDEVLIRTGKELGVDDYLTKPFSDETLLATIKGKLKRFKKLTQTVKKK